MRKPLTLWLDIFGLPFDSYEIKHEKKKRLELRKSQQIVLELPILL